MFDVIYDKPEGTRGLSCINKSLQGDGFNTYQSFAGLCIINKRAILQEGFVYTYISYCSIEILLARYRCQYFLGTTCCKCLFFLRIQILLQDLLMYIL